MEAQPLQGASPPPPVHVAIIMDGNGRWAKARGLPRTAGHKRGAEAVKRAVESAGKLGVRYLTLFSFSSENWRRPLAEVSDLMGLLRYYLQHEIHFLHEHRIRFRSIGDRARLDADIVTQIERAEAARIYTLTVTPTPKAWARNHALTRGCRFVRVVRRAAK